MSSGSTGGTAGAHSGPNGSDEFLNDPWASGDPVEGSEGGVAGAAGDSCVGHSPSPVSNLARQDFGAPQQNASSSVADIAIGCSAGVSTDPMGSTGSTGSTGSGASAALAAGVVVDAADIDPAMLLGITVPVLDGQFSDFTELLEKINDHISANSVCLPYDAVHGYCRGMLKLVVDVRDAAEGWNVDLTPVHAAWTAVMSRVQAVRTPDKFLLSVDGIRFARLDFIYGSVYATIDANIVDPEATHGRGFEMGLFCGPKPFLGKPNRPVAMPIAYSAGRFGTWMSTWSAFFAVNNPWVANSLQINDNIDAPSTPHPGTDPRIVGLATSDILYKKFRKHPDYTSVSADAGALVDFRMKHGVFLGVNDPDAETAVVGETVALMQKANHHSESPHSFGLLQNGDLALFAKDIIKPGDAIYTNYGSRAENENGTTYMMPATPSTEETIALRLENLDKMCREIRSRHGRGRVKTFWHVVLHGLIGAVGLELETNKKFLDMDMINKVISLVSEIDRGRGPNEKILTPDMMWMLSVALTGPLACRAFAQHWVSQNTGRKVALYDGNAMWTGVVGDLPCLEDKLYTIEDAARRAVTPGQRTPTSVSWVGVACVSRGESSLLQVDNDMAAMMPKFNPVCHMNPTDLFGPIDLGEQMAQGAFTLGYLRPHSRQFYPEEFLKDVLFTEDQIIRLCGEGAVAWPPVNNRFRRDIVRMANDTASRLTGAGYTFDGSNPGTTLHATGRPMSKKSVGLLEMQIQWVRMVEERMDAVRAVLTEERKQWHARRQQEEAARKEAREAARLARRREAEEAARQRAAEKAAREEDSSSGEDSSDDDDEEILPRGRHTVESPVPLPAGWRCEGVYRQSGIFRGRLDYYWTAPNGDTIRSQKGLIAALAASAQMGAASSSPVLPDADVAAAGAPLPAAMALLGLAEMEETTVVSRRNKKRKREFPASKHVPEPANKVARWMLEVLSA